MKKYEKNTIALTLYVIALVEMGLFFVGGLALAGEWGFLITLLAWVVGAFSCLALLGFAEIIVLLQKSSDALEKMLKQPAGESNKTAASGGVLKDIEANLPKI